MDEQLKLNFYWDTPIVSDRYGSYFDGAIKKFWILNERISHLDLVQKVCAYRGLDINTVRLRMQLRVPTMWVGVPDVFFNLYNLNDDEDMELLWNFPSNFRMTLGASIYVDVENIRRGGETYDGGANRPVMMESPIHNIVRNDAWRSRDNDFSFQPSVRGMTSSVPGGIFGMPQTEAYQSSSSSNSMSTMVATAEGAHPSSTMPPPPPLPQLDPQLHHVTEVTEIVAEGPPVANERGFMDVLGPTSDLDQGAMSEGEPVGSFGDPIDDASDDDNVVCDQPPHDSGTGPSNASWSSFENFGSLQDMGSGEQIMEDTSGFLLNQWSEDNCDLRLGMRFVDKRQAIYAIRQWSLKRSREFKVLKSKSNMWTARCNNSAGNVPCDWYIRVIEKSTHHQWQITVYRGEHTCMPIVVNNNNRSLTSKLIAPRITHLVRDDPEIHVKAIIAEVKNVFQLGCSYRKGWNARKLAIEHVFGDWTTTFHILPSYMQALGDANPGTIIEWKHLENSTNDVKVFDWLFWSFRPLIEGFHHCRPVISVDGTHLRGAYRGVLLVASCWDADNHVFPIACAIVDEESSASWGWFLSLLRSHVVLQRPVCLISDRHKGILSSVSRQRGWQPPLAVHRYCLRHIRANFNVKFKNRDLAKAMYKAGAECREEKFMAIMDEIKIRSRAAYDWLAAIDHEKWTLAYDGGYRYGCMTTNLSESLNSVLKKGRALPIKAMVEMFFGKLVRYFLERRESGLHCRHPFPPKIWKIFSHNEAKSRSQIVTGYNSELGIYSVKTPFRGDGRGNKDYTVRMREKCCTCNKWSAFGIPCSHVFAVCRERGVLAADLVDKFYSKTCYRETYQGNFYPVANESFWRASPFNLVHFSPNMKGCRPGRLQNARIPCDMDYRNPDSPRRCGNCHMPGHTRRNCPGRNMGAE